MAKPKAPEQLTETLLIRVTKTEKKRVEELAGKEERSLSAQARRMLVRSFVEPARATV